MEPMATDIIDQLLEDHEVVRSLFGELDDLPPERRGDLFRTIVDALARHEAAEEAVLHPTTRDEVDGGQDVARAVLEQESRAEDLMARMERMDPVSDEFLDAFLQLRDDVEAHADYEEREEFPRLREGLSEERLRGMAKGFEEIGRAHV